ncbi:MAG TPA: toprim domain-containing protein [Ktedonobacteraceae bacterium]|nr:toprim domain-containing protein [Ktedonobacteraceae bacterium]
MSNTLQTTRRGNLIHRLSLDDLIDVVESGEQLRSYCPIHGGDHQRSLSIARATGWGYCHCCHATVLVEIPDPMTSERRWNNHGRRGTGNDTLSPPTLVAHRPASSLRPDPLRRAPTATPIPHWQRDEVAALSTIAPVMRASLTASKRAQRYLDERGIPTAVGHAAGIGYLSHSTWEHAPVSAEQRSLLKRWIGRLVFPLGSPDGQGFIGRTLLRWEMGMDENTHKAVLDQPGAPRRWIKTNPAGWFGFEAPGRLAEWVILVEGGFDRLALLAAGFPATSVLALVGTAARSSWLVRSAPQVRGVVLALDADDGGKTAMERLAVEFRQAGLTIVLCPPPQDQWGKDWNERWRRLGPQALWPLYETVAQQRTTLHERK